MLEIEQDYAKLLEEAQSLPDPAESIQSANKSRTKKTRSNLEFNEDSLMSRNALLSQDNDESDTDEPPKVLKNFDVDYILIFRLFASQTV